MQAPTPGDPATERLLDEAQKRARAYIGAIAGRRVYPDEAAMAGLEADGMAWFGPTHWAGRPALRFSVSSWATTDGDIGATLDAVACAVTALRAESVSAIPLAAD